VQIITIRQQPRLAELVEGIDAHLDHEEQQKDSRYLKEAPDIDQVPELRPAKRKRDGRE